MLGTRHLGDGRTSRRRPDSSSQPVTPSPCCDLHSSSSAMASSGQGSGALLAFFVLVLDVGVVLWHFGFGGEGDGALFGSLLQDSSQKTPGFLVLLSP